MVTSASWIKVELSPHEIWDASQRGRSRFEYARARGFTPRGFGTLETNTLGCLGEAAVARYEGVRLDPDWTWEADKRRGHDVAGWGVRTRSWAGAGLNLHRGDTGKFLLIYGHEPPVMWLIGQLTAEEGFPLGRQRESGTGDRLWWLVDDHHLRPLPEQRGYRHCGARLFPCELCRTAHPLRQHVTAAVGVP